LPAADRPFDFEESVKRYRPTPWALDGSGAAKADRHFAGLDDHGNVALVLGNGQHLFEPCRIFQDVDVFERYIALRVRLTGVARVRSEILPEDQNFFRHNTTSRF
jgi:hypothetical protein